MAHYLKICAWCGEPFESTRSDARYCGPTCRKRHQRGTPTGAYVMPPARDYEYEARDVTEDEVLGAVLGLRQALAVLSAAAVAGPPDYRPLCSRLSHAVGGMMEVEGL